MTQTPKFRAPAIDGRMMYPLSKDNDFANSFSAIDWVTPVLVAKGYGHPYANDRILIVDAAATEVVYRVSAGRPAVIKYTRNRDGAMGFPAELTPAEWVEFRDQMGFDDDEEYLATRFYTAVHGPQEYDTRSYDLTDYVDLPADLLDPSSVEDVDSSFTYKVAAPYLIFGTIYSNALPGHLSDIRARLAKAVQEAVPSAKIWVHSAEKDGTISGHVSLEYDDRRTVAVKVGRRTEHRVARKDFQFAFPIPLAIAGPNKKAAIANYEELLAEIIGAVSSQKAVACGHCDGAGVISVAG